MISISHREPNWPLAGYAPGSYLNHCLTCGDYYYGDKRAIECLACAVDTVKSKQAQAEAKAQTRIGIGIKLGIGSFCDD